MKTGQGFLIRTQPSRLRRIAKSSSNFFSSLQTAQMINTFITHNHSDKMYEFCLGDEVMSFTPPSIETDDPPSTLDAYFVLEGRLRVLCQNTYLQRSISADVLEAGAIFGVDQLFCKSPLPYRAIATRFCRVVHIPYQQLAVQLEQLPQLHPYFNQTAQQRERLIFFKGFTQQRSTSIHTLKHVLLPQLREHRVEAGAYLAQVLPTTGYFWLRMGQIFNQAKPESSSTIGQSWGYPDATPEDWIAQTDLLIYHLPLDSWDVLNLLYL
jgi:ATP-binding cassette subfamily B protein